MRVIAIVALGEFWQLYPDSEQSLRSWYKAVTSEQWQSPHDVKRLYATARVLLDGRIVFNIAGNKYRLVVWIEYPKQRIYIKFIGSHKEYDRIDGQTVELSRRRGRA